VWSFWNKTDVDVEQNFVQMGDIELPDDDPVQQGVYRGGSGRNLRPIWLKGENSPPPTTYSLCVIVQVIDAWTT